MNLIARCDVEGLPVPQGSMRPVVSKSTGRSFVKQPPAMIAWRARVSEAARAQLRGPYVTDGPVHLVAHFVLARPKSAKKSLTGSELAAKRPDLSKLVRAVEDALTGVWYADDSLVTSIDAYKRVAEPGEPPGVVLELWQV